MTVHLTSSNKGVEFSVENPNGDWVDEAALGATTWSAKLQLSGDYKLLVTNNRSKSQREPTYTLEIMVTDAGIASDSGEVAREAVWTPPQQVWSQVQNKCREPESPQLSACTASAMRRLGASPHAIEFTRLIKGEGWMESFREMGKVDLASVFYPFRANTNKLYVLVNGSPGVVETSLTGEYQENTDYIAERRRVNIKTDPLYRSLVSRFPKLELELSRNTFENMRPMPQGGQEFVFSYALLNGCRACEVVGQAHVAFSFDGAGNFLGTKLLRLSRAGSN